MPEIQETRDARLVSTIDAYEHCIYESIRNLSRNIEAAIFNMPRKPVHSWCAPKNYIKAYIWTHPLLGEMDLEDEVVNPIWSYTTTGSLSTKGLYARPGRFISLDSTSGTDISKKIHYFQGGSIITVPLTYTVSTSYTTGWTT